MEAGSQRIFQNSTKWDVLLGLWCMEQPFQRALCFWGSLEVSFSTHALQLRVKLIGQDHLYQT